MIQDTEIIDPEIQFVGVSDLFKFVVEKSGRLVYRISLH